MLFIHGHQFLRYNKKYYTSGSLNNKLFERYMVLFGDVTVFANQKDANKIDLKHINEKSLVDNVNLVLMHNKNNIFKIFKNRKKVKSAVLNNDYVVIRMPSFYGVLAIYYAEKQNKKYLIELVGCPWDSLWNHSIKGKIIAPLMWFITKLSLKDAPYVLYVTSEFLQKRYPTKGINLGCSDVALPSLNEKILEQRIYKIKNMDSKKPIIIGTIGAVNVIYKGQKYIIEAISKLNNEGYNFEYHLVGGGDKSFLESVAKEYDILDKVKFHGSLPHEEIFNWLDTIDIYIQPSMTEGLPRALIEAMSRGCPSIGSNVGGIPELISSDFIFKSKDINDLAKKLIKILNGNMLREARENFNKSKEFESSVLNKKRNEFYLNYKNSL